MKYLKSRVSGGVADVIAETDDYYWLKRQIGSNQPFTILKMDASWEPYTPTPQVGDIWTASGGASEYRVIGVDEKRKQYHIVRAEEFGPAYAEGGYPKLRQGEIQYESQDVGAIFTRQLPETMLKFGRSATT